MKLFEGNGIYTYRTTAWILTHCLILWKECMNEVLLVGASQAGDKAAFGSLINRYYKNIYRFAYQYTGNHHDADEVCQETFLRALNSIRKLKDGNCFKGWIFTIASNLLRKRIKESKRENTLGTKSPDGAAVELAEDKNTQPFEVLSSKEKAMIIQRHLQEMPEQMRLVTILVFMEGLTQKDAAGVLSCSEASASRHLDAARKWLRARLQNLV